MSNINSTDLKQLLKYDFETGAFTWLVSPSKPIKAGSLAGSLHHKGYIQICINKKNYLAHRLAWLYYYGTLPNKTIDHINGKKNDNRITNLRDISQSNNCQNLLRSRGSSGLIGAHFQKLRNRWSSSIKLNGIKTHLGYFKTAEEANTAYLAAKRSMHPFNTL